MATRRLNPVRHDRIVRALKDGHFRATAARLAGVQPATLSTWLNTGADYADLPGGEVPESKQDVVRLYRACIVAEATALDGALASVRTAAGEDWRAGAWLLERRAREDWQPRKEVIVGLARTEKRLVLDDATREALGTAALARQLGTAEASEGSVPGPRRPHDDHGEVKAQALKEDDDVTDAP